MAVPRPRTQFHPVMPPHQTLSPSSPPVETGRRGDSQKGKSYTLHLAPSGRTLLVHHVPGSLPPCPHTRSPVSASCLMGSDHSPSSLPPGGLPRRGPYRPRLISFSSSYTTP